MLHGNHAGDFSTFNQFLAAEGIMQEPRVLIRKIALDEFLESRERRRAHGEAKRTKGESKMVGQGVRASRR